MDGTCRRTVSEALAQLTPIKSIPDGVSPRPAHTETEYPASVAYDTIESKQQYTDQDVNDFVIEDDESKGFTQEPSPKEEAMELTEKQDEIEQLQEERQRLRQQQK
eukprot:866653_1